MNENACILVCVTVQRDCDRLIRQGKALSLKTGEPLHVLHVCSGKNLLGNPDAAEALNYLFSLAHEVDAEMNILYEADVPAAIARYAAAHGAATLILGPDKSGFAARLRKLLSPNAQLLCEP